MDDCCFAISITGDDFDGTINVGQKKKSKPNLSI